MAWTKSTPSQSSSKLGAILPLIIVLFVVAGGAWIGYQIYLSIGQMRGQVSQKMGKGNVVFTKDGVKVGVKHVEVEDYVDKTQSYMVKAWNLSSKQQDRDLALSKSEKKTKKS